jgi:general L-amino acid transport system ATP-binding protein
MVDGIALNHKTKSMEQIRSRVGMVFQQFNLFPHLTVLENLTLGPVRSKKI